MKKSTNLGLIMLTVCLLLVSLAIAAEGIKYDFDEVEVVYAAEFTAEPVNAEADNWLAELAGGEDNPITVLYGIVNLRKNGEPLAAEEFIKVSGEKGSERFLLNSAGYDYYEGTGKYKNIKSFFWSAKKLVGDVVIKDFTPPVKSITLYRKFDESQNMYAIILSSSNDGEKASEEFWTADITENLYQADMGTLTHTGDQTSSSS